MSGWIKNRLHAAGVRPEELAGVVLTHCHLDHTGAARTFLDLGIPLFAHHLELPILHGSAPPPTYGDNFSGRMLALGQKLLPKSKPLHEARPLHNDESLFGSAWHVVPAPGHSPGSMALWNRDTGDLITGDTLVADWGTPSGPHPVYTADLPQAQASARALLELAPKRICPGHGPVLEASRFEKLRIELSTRDIPCMQGGH